MLAKEYYWLVDDLRSTGVILYACDYDSSHQHAVRMSTIIVLGAHSIHMETFQEVPAAS